MIPRLVEYERAVQGLLKTGVSADFHVKLMLIADMEMSLNNQFVGMTEQEADCFIATNYVAYTAIKNHVGNDKYEHIENGW